MRLPVLAVVALLLGICLVGSTALSVRKRLTTRDHEARLLARPKPKFADVKSNLDESPKFDNAPGSDKVGNSQSGVTVVTNNNKLDQILHIGDDDDDDNDQGSEDGHDIVAASLDGEKPSADKSEGEQPAEDDGIQHNYEQQPHEEQRHYVNKTGSSKNPKIKFKKYDGGRVGDLSKHEISQFLNTMNEARAEVNVPELEWSEELQAYAQRWVTRLAQNHCDLEHSPGPEGHKPYGENLAWFGGYTGDPKAAVKNWLSEKAIYDHDGPEKCMRPHAHRTCGHYTQVVWRDSLRVGCAIATCVKSAVYSCNFDPIGNFVGKKPY